MSRNDTSPFAPCRRYFRLDRRDLAYLTFIMEAYEGLATVTTLEPKETLVSITTLSSRAAELDGLITALRGEITLTETACAAEGGTCHARQP
ncbi:MAG TPA: DUF4911 domain-containing protein [Geobacteraceae bacterium]